MAKQKTITQAAAILQFYQQLEPDFVLPPGVEILYPFKEATAWQLTTAFYRQFYSDTMPRTYIFGINPGRFGGGITGIPFTDPVRLEQDCGIPNNLPQKAELSSVFIYEMIAAYGGPASFFREVYITSLSPLGFTQNGVNLNYYDDKALQRACEPFMTDCIRYQQQHIPGRDVCICLGEGTNYKYFSKLNQQHGFFSRIIPLPHPRWVMQYRRNSKDQFIDKYLQALEAVAG